MHAAEVGEALWFNDPEILNEGERVGVLPSVLKKATEFTLRWIHISHGRI